MRKTRKTKGNRDGTATQKVTTSRYVPSSDPKPGVRYVGVTLSNKPKHEPKTVPVDQATVRRLRSRKPVTTPRRRVVEHDDPHLAAVLSHQIRTIEDAVAKLEHTSKARHLPAALVTFHRAVRRAFNKYMTQLDLAR